MKKNTLKIKIASTPETTYPIEIGGGLLKSAQELIAKNCAAKKFLIVTNETVHNLYKDSINIENSEFFILKDGEKYKNLDSYKAIQSKAQEFKLERKDAFIALGGGVIGDLTGFCAATYLRGIDFIQIPTTLLSQVDSSVGGKVGINTEFGKNLLGAFYQPKLVIADTNTLKTLEERQFKTGLAEVIKYAFLEKTAGCGFDFLNFLQKNTNRILDRDDQILQELVAICCQIKAAVVSQDEREKGLRMILNLGHTFAHAIEKVTSYTRYTHGEAVSLGIALAFKLSLRKGLIEKEYCEEGINLLKSYGLIHEFPSGLNTEELLDAMLFDKKVKDEKIQFVLPSEKCKVRVFTTVSRDEII